MGNTWTVKTWGKTNLDRRGVPEGKEHYIYAYSDYWQGESFFKALLKMREAKSATGSGCVVLEWRGK